MDWVGRDWAITLSGLALADQLFASGQAGTEIIPIMNDL
jgi:hypothetical protein